MTSDQSRRDREVLVRSFFHGLMRGSQEERSLAKAVAEGKVAPLRRFAVRVNDTITVYESDAKTKEKRKP